MKLFQWSLTYFLLIASNYNSKCETVDEVINFLTFSWLPYLNLNFSFALSMNCFKGLLSLVSTKLVNSAQVGDPSSSIL